MCLSESVSFDRMEMEKEVGGGSRRSRQQMENKGVF
jgi:hypothetical protein